MYIFSIFTLALFPSSLLSISLRTCHRVLERRESSSLKLYVETSQVALILLTATDKRYGNHRELVFNQVLDRCSVANDYNTTTSAAKLECGQEDGKLAGGHLGNLNSRALLHPPRTSFTFLRSHEPATRTRFLFFFSSTTFPSPY